MNTAKKEPENYSPKHTRPGTFVEGSDGSKYRVADSGNLIRINPGPLSKKAKRIRDRKIRKGMK